MMELRHRVTALFDLPWLCALYGCAILVGHPVLAQQPDGPPTFDVASVKRSDPGSYGFSINRQPTKVEYVNCDLSTLLREAFDIRDYQLEAPGWVRSGNLMTASGKYVVRATFPPGTSRERLRLMLQTLLKDRFGLQFHVAKREQSVYALAVDRGGPKFQVDPTGQGGILSASRGHLKGSHVTMNELASILSRQVDRPVIDATGIQGTTDVTLDWVPEELLSASGSADIVHDSDSIFAAVRKQLGLQLVSRRFFVDVVAIDHIDRDPLEN